MKHRLIAFLISIVAVVGLFFLIATPNQFYKKESLSSGSVILKNYLLKLPKPQRIEVFSYTEKFKKEVTELKKMKIPQDKNSNVYFTIQFFTDEDDPKAPLIAQVRVYDLKTQNLQKEESLNLN